MIENEIFLLCQWFLGRLKNVVIFIQTILSFGLSRKACFQIRISFSYTPPEMQENRNYKLNEQDTKFSLNSLNASEEGWNYYPLFGTQPIYVLYNSFQKAYRRLVYHRRPVDPRKRSH